LQKINRKVLSSRIIASICKCKIKSEQERGKKMRTTVYCKSTAHNVHSFYLVAGNKEYYLFSQGYRQGVHDYFANGVHIDNAIDFSKCKHDTAIARTMNKLPKYISYIESEYELMVLDKTIKKHRKNQKLMLCA